MESVVHTQRQLLIAKLALIVTCLLWASAFVVIRRAVTAYGPAELGFLRYAIASVVMCFLYFIRTRKNTLTVSDILKSMLLGVVGIGIYTVTLNYGEVYVSSATASFILSQVPVMTAVLAYFLLNERVDKQKFVGLLVSFIGIMIIAAENFSNFHMGLSTVLIIVSAVCGSVFSVMQKPLLERVDPFQFAAWAIWGATLVMAFWAPQTVRQFLHAPVSITWGVVFIGVFPAAIAYALWSFVLIYMPVNKAITYLYSMPLIVLFIAWFTLHEFPSMMNLMGGLVALFGVVIVNFKKKASPLGTEGLT